MFFNYITLFTALLISSVAIFYSVAGLATIFAASALSVIVMGTALEVGKLVVAVWLHRNWSHAVWWLKTYLTTAVVVLMFITSMGIFGYLSKSHVEQTAASTESVATIERIDADIARQNAIISRAEEKIRRYEDNGSGADLSLQTQIDREQERIDSAYSRVQAQVDAQLVIVSTEEDKINERISVYQERVDSIDKLVEELRGYVASGEIKKAQGIVGAAQDGQYGPKTAARFDAFYAEQEAKRAEALNAIEDIRNAPNTTIKNARDRIDELNKVVQREIEQSNELITRLRSQLGNTTEQNIGQLIEEEQAKITAASESLDGLTEEKFVLETQQRKLEAEVGPIKYIAEFVYGEADTTILETAVRWVILIIIIVFDPLAVLLLIAAQHSFDSARERRAKEKEGTKEVEAVAAPVEVPQKNRPLERDVGDPIEEMIEMRAPVGSTYVFPTDLISDATYSSLKIDEVLEAYNDDRLATKHDMEVDWTEEDHVEEVIETMDDEEELDEPEPSIKEVEQIVDIPVEDEDDETEDKVEEPKTVDLELNSEILEMLRNLQHDQNQVLDELTKRKQILTKIRKNQE